MSCSRDESASAPSDSFAAKVDLAAFGRAALHDNGRIKAVDSYTHAVMHEITGPKQIDGQSDTYTYLDIMFRPHAYLDREVIYVRKKQLREPIAQALRRDADDLRSTMELTVTSEARAQLRDAADAIDARIGRFLDTGLISERMLQRPAVEIELDRMRADVIRTKKFVDELDLARLLMRPGVLSGGLRIVPPLAGDETTPWMAPADLERLAALDLAPDQIAATEPIRKAWEELERAWNAHNAESANTALAMLVDKLPHVNPSLYPASQRDGWPWTLARETASGWLASGVGFVALVSGAIGLVRTGRRRLALAPGVMAVIFAGMLAAALTIGRADWLALESAYFRNYHWFTLIWMVYMFSVIFLLMSVVYRWRTARIVGMTIFVLAFALHTGGLLMRWYVADRWPNSNMFEAVTTAAWFGGAAAIIIEIIVRKSSMRNLFALGSAAASMTALMAAHFLPQYLNASISNKMPVLNDIWLYIHTNVIIFSYCLIFMAAMVAMLYLGYRIAAALGGYGGPHHYARVGGAGSLIVTRPSGESVLESARTSLGQVFDGATMILMELSFVLLWTGLCMGAMWADHSWGRPWGWDPKEVFALNTFIVFLVLVHVRYKAKDKGLWTSLLVLAGCAVMLFNWIFINFKISGLHSYA